MTSRYEGHTPEPWRLEWEQEYGDFGFKLGSRYLTGVKGGQDDEWVARIDDDYGHPRTMADFRLIADAPSLLAQRDELLGALVALYAYAKEMAGELVHQPSGGSAVRARVEAAIAKVAGR